MKTKKTNNKEKHHYVQAKYIAQWQNPKNHNQLQVFEHDTEKIEKSGAKSNKFWKKDFNVLSSSEKDYFLPERVSAIIDNKGLEVIKKLNELKKIQLNNIERSILATYTALQYTRTPRYREEADEFFNVSLGNLLKDYWKKQGGIKISRIEILKTKPENIKEEALLKEIEEMTDEEFQSKIPDIEILDQIKISLNTEGHSKSIFKAPENGEKIYDFQWVFFISPKGTSFVTSDNPCFSISSDPKRPYSGLCSKYAKTIFPLSPNVLLYIDNSKKSRSELFINASKNIVRDLNILIIRHSYDRVIAKDKKHLESLMKGYKHKKSRKGKFKTMGNYQFTTLE